MTEYSYIKRWRCTHCGSEDVSVAVEWMESVEPVDQDHDELGPEGSGSGDISRLIASFCNSCDFMGNPYESLERKRVRV